MRKTLVVIAHLYYFPGEKHHFNPDDIWFKRLLLMPERIWTDVRADVGVILDLSSDALYYLHWRRLCWALEEFHWICLNDLESGFPEVKDFKFLLICLLLLFPSIRVIVNYAAEESLDRQRKPSASKNESKMSWMWQFSTFLEGAFNPSCSDADLQALASGHFLDFLLR